MPQLIAWPWPGRLRRPPLDIQPCTAFTSDLIFAPKCPYLPGEVTAGFYRSISLPIAVIEHLLPDQSDYRFPG